MMHFSDHFLFQIQYTLAQLTSIIILSYSPDCSEHTTYYLINLIHRWEFFRLMKILWNLYEKAVAR